MATLTYDTPAGSGGTAPVTVACTPPNGTAIPIGDNKVTCVATDSEQRTGSCTFAVLVTPRPAAPRLAITRILAFGDSITAGVDGDTASLTPVPYPSALQTLLTNRYYDQSFTVSNEGLGGEFTEQGLRRLSGLLRSQNPQVVLILEGANDLNRVFGTGQDRMGLPSTADALRDMIKLGHQAGAEVFIGTLTPQRRNSPKGGGADLVTSLNDLIRWGAERENAPVVDLFQALGGEPDPYVGADGLHPNAAGYRRVAETFFDALRGRYESAPLLPFLTLRR